jgi:hypothetical protein
MEDSTLVYEPGEYCEICLGTARLGKWHPPPVGADEGFTICAWCYEDEPKFKAWFMQMMEEALEESPEYEKMPDGTWKRVEDAPSAS